MILSSVEITDFLSIKGTITLDFDRKVTILLGSNDHGKTNILRAIEHLNDEVPITDEESNWDAEGTPSISFVFSLTAAERKDWKAIVEEIVRRREAATRQAQESESADEEIGVEDPTIPATATPGTRVTGVATGTPKKVPAPVKDDEAEEEPGLRDSEVPESALNPSPTNLVIRRKGVGASLQFEGADIKELPVEMEDFLKRKKPRVELFRALSGTLQDSATASTISTNDYEFLQGVFFYADLDPRQSAHIFNQDDKTIRALDKASARLDASLRGLWGQGTELHFELRHKGSSSSIEFLADDPAIKSRKARMSKRSAGVTQFFRVSMVLYARRKKNPANSYIYLFDEPGVLLHPQGQRDLLQVFEQLADENQIVYATHSLFLLNQNFPERHRLIFKSAEGTKVDQKPYRQNWKLATDALGVYLSSNILFSSRVLLVEGDSDPLYLYELFRQLNRVGDVDVDLNTLGIMSFYDHQNLRFLLQIFKREEQDVSVFVIADGDSEGKVILQRVAGLCKKLGVTAHRLPEGKSIEDFCLFEDVFLQAVEHTLRAACDSEGKPVPDNLKEQVNKSWEDHKAQREKSERRAKNEKGEKDEKDDRKTAGRWFKEVSEEIIKDEASKVVLARTYIEICREMPPATISPGDTKEAKALCQEIISKLAISGIRAVKAIERPA